MVTPCDPSGKLIKTKLARMICRRPPSSSQTVSQRVSLLAAKNRPFNRRFIPAICIQWLRRCLSLNMFHFCLHFVEVKMTPRCRYTVPVVSVEISVNEFNFQLEKERSGYYIAGVNRLTGEQRAAWASLSGDVLFLLLFVISMCKRRRTCVASISCWRSHV